MTGLNVNLSKKIAKFEAAMKRRFLIKSIFYKEFSEVKDWSLNHTEHILQMMMLT